MENICDKYAEMMFDYLDGELTEAEKNDFDEHIAGCVSCRDELALRRKTLEYIADSAYTVSRDLVAAITGSIRAAKRRNRMVRTGSTIAACVVMATFFTVYFMMGRSKLMSDDALVPEVNNAYTYAAENIQTAPEAEEAEEADDDFEDEGSSETAPETEAPLRAVLAFGFSAEANIEEDTTETPAEEKAETEASGANELFSDDILTPKSAGLGGADAVELYTGIYAPDYAGKIACLAISSAAQPESMTLLRDGDNYTSYIASYSDNLYDEIVKIVSDGVYSVNLGEQTEQYILYVVIK